MVNSIGLTSIVGLHAIPYMVYSHMEDGHQLSEFWLQWNGDSDGHLYHRVPDSYLYEQRGGSNVA